MKPSSLRFRVAPALAALLLAACSSSTGNNNNPDSGPGNNSCTDQTGMQSPTVGIISTGGAYGGYSFSPACVQINKGQSVTFTGNYSLHTLERNGQSVATATNPLPANAYSGTSPVTFGPFPDSGDFGTICTIHGFTGLVRVNP